jgi:hypothetical protein
MMLTWLIGGVAAGGSTAGGCLTVAHYGARLTYHRRARHGAATAARLRPAPAKPWYPPTLPEAPAAWEHALDARFANRLARDTPRELRPAVVAACALEAVHRAAILPAAAAAVAAAAAADRRDFERWPHLAPVEWSTDIMPAVTA